MNHDTELMYSRSQFCANMIARVRESAFEPGTLVIRVCTADNDLDETAVIATLCASKITRDSHEEEANGRCILHLTTYLRTGTPYSERVQVNHVILHPDLKWKWVEDRLECVRA